MKNAKTKRPARARGARSVSRRQPRLFLDTRPAWTADVSPDDRGAVAHASGAYARGLFGRAPELHRPRLVLFLGTPGNGYAPLSALWFAALASEGKARAVLAYAEGGPRLTTDLLAAAAESGLDGRRLIARTLTPEMTAAADLVITLGDARRRRPKLPRTVRRSEHWTIRDTSPPASRRGSRSARAEARPAPRDTLAEARRLRDDLRTRVAMLVFSEGWGRPEISREDARVTPARAGRPAGASPRGASASGRGFTPPPLVPETPTVLGRTPRLSTSAPSPR